MGAPAGKMGWNFELGNCLRRLLMSSIRSSSTVGSFSTDNCGITFGCTNGLAPIGANTVTSDAARLMTGLIKGKLVGSPIGGCVDCGVRGVSRLLEGEMDYCKGNNETGNANPNRLCMNKPKKLVNPSPSKIRRASYFFQEFSFSNCVLFLARPIPVFPVIRNNFR